MYFVLDNLLASLIGGTVIFVILAMQTQMQEAAVDQVGMHMAKNQTLAFAEWIQEDFANIGAGMPGDASILEVSAHSGDADQTGTFRFQRHTSSVNTTVIEVGYTLSVVDSLTVDGQKVPLYQVQRTFDGTAAGSSAPSLTEFSITMLDESGQATALTAQARQLQIRFSVAFPFASADAYLRETYWHTTLPLPNLEDE